MKAVSHLTQTRGGLRSLGMDGFLARLLRFVDTNSAFLLGTNLYLADEAEVGACLPRHMPFKLRRFDEIRRGDGGLGGGEGGLGVGGGEGSLAGIGEGNGSGSGTGEQGLRMGPGERGIHDVGEARDVRGFGRVNVQRFVGLCGTGGGARY
jgi:hypothetical protein